MSHGITVIRELGQGSFGTVMLVRRVASQSLYAMKLFKSGELLDKHEVDVLKKLRHPHIVQYRDLIVYDKKDAIIMEYYEGGDLSTYLRRQENPLNESLVWEWFMQLSTAVSYFHARGIIHRDLKPANCFLNNSELKIGDFGLASVLEKELESGITSQSRGTALYMAPELFDEVAHFGPKSDIWGLGCIVYEMCTLKFPFTSLRSIIYENCSPIQEYYSYGLKMTVERMLNKIPQDRITMNEILSWPKICEIIPDALRNLDDEAPTRSSISESKISTSGPSKRAESAMSRYNKLDELGRGHYGTVWLAESVKTKAKFAMKVFEINVSDLKISHEIDLMLDVRHPHLVQLYDVIEYEKKTAIVMDYCEQGDLDKYLRERNGELLSQDQVLTWTCELISAVAYLKEMKIVHRDIKPANVLLTNNSLKLGDFGLGLVVEVTASRATSPGTVQYMAPELFDERPRYSSKSDMFGLGCVVYEMCALKPAFFGSYGQIIARIQRNRPEALSNAFSEELKSLVREMMSSEPEDRPFPADLLLRDLVKPHLPEILLPRKTRRY